MRSTVPISDRPLRRLWPGPDGEALGPRRPRRWMRGRHALLVMVVCAGRVSSGSSRWSARGPGGGRWRLDRKVLWFSDVTEQTRALADAEAERDGLCPAARCRVAAAPMAARCARPRTWSIATWPTPRRLIADRDDGDRRRASSLPARKTGRVEPRPGAPGPGVLGRPNNESHHVVVAGERRLLELAEQALGRRHGRLGARPDRPVAEDLKDQLEAARQRHAEVLENLATAPSPSTARTCTSSSSTAPMRGSGAWTRTAWPASPITATCWSLQRERRRLPEQSGLPGLQAPSASGSTAPDRAHRGAAAPARRHHLAHDRGAPSLRRRALHLRGRDRPPGTRELLQHA